MKELSSRFARIKQEIKNTRVHIGNIQSQGLEPIEVKKLFDYSIELLESEKILDEWIKEYKDYETE